MSPADSPSLHGLRVLIAEDNALIGDYIRQILTDLDCAVVGPFDVLDDVLNAAATIDLDGALLDIQLGEADVQPAAIEFARRGIPFILITGRSNRTGLPALLANAPMLNKPFDITDLERLVGDTFRPAAGA